MDTPQEKEPDLIDFLSDVNMQILHISKNMEEIRANTGWVKRLEASSQLIGQFNYSALENALGEARQSLSSCGHTLKQIHSVLVGAVTLRRRMQRQYGLILALVALLLVVTSAYIGAMYLPGRPQFGRWSCEALGGKYSRQKGGVTFCYYLVSAPNPNR